MRGYSFSLGISGCDATFLGVGTTWISSSRSRRNVGQRNRRILDLEAKFLADKSAAPPNLFD
jgi:hypothetical protein